MANELKRVDSYQYPSAHLAHLTDGQQEALDRFKSLCQEKGYYHPAVDESNIYASHDDETLLRFLRARKFRPEDAFKQLKDTEDWRKQNHIEELYDTIDIQEYEEARRLYPQWTGRRDRRGIPVYVFQVSYLDSKIVSKYTNMVSKNPTIAHKNSTIPSKLLTLFALYENLTRFVLPFCSAMKDRPHLETPISQSSNIVDISGVGLRQFWNLKNHMQDASQLATAYYPETLDRIFIIGAPVFFPTVWGWIKRWFDPITVSKIFILSSSDMKSTLEKYIDPANIPKKYGGQLDFNFGDMPVLEPAIVNALDMKEGCSGLPKQRGEPTLPVGPIKWHEGRGKEMEAIGVGLQSDDGTMRKTTLARVHTDFQGMHGVTRGPPHNTPIDWNLEKVVTTAGTSTQPKEEGDLFYGADLVNGNSPGTSTPQNKDTNTTADKPTSSINTVPPPTMDPTISAGGPENTSATLPAQPAESSPTPQPAGSSQPRTGTSDTRFAQQERTHAAGTLADGTPHVVDYGAGDKAATVETATVGQAPKDVAAVLPRPEEPPALTVVDQARVVVGRAYEATVNVVEEVAEAVGVRGKGGEGEGKGDGAEEKRDERVEGVEDGSVEEFLRSKFPSEGAHSEMQQK